MNEQKVVQNDLEEVRERNFEFDAVKVAQIKRAWNGGIYTSNSELIARHLLD